MSVAIPAYNEEDNVAELAARLTKVFDDLQDQYDFEVVVCENGSVDSTYQRLLAVREADPRFKIVQLVRNFHMEGGMCAALAHVKGDACVIMSADLQDPPEMIPQMIAKWEEGYGNVYTVITKRHGESIVRRALAQSFYWVINRLSDTPVPRNASDFRLVSREAYQVFNSMAEANKMVRAMWGWVGVPSTGLTYERLERAGGNSKFRFGATTGYAIRGILASSRAPLKAMPLMGLAMSFVAFAVLVGISIRALFYGVPFPGFGTLACLMMLMFGFLFLFLGIVSEYVGMIFEQVRARPFYVVRRVDE